MRIHRRARALRSSECACFTPSQRGGTATDALRGDSPCASAGRKGKCFVLADGRLPGGPASGFTVVLERWARLKVCVLSAR